jgi:hypothetical protein
VMGAVGRCRVSLYDTLGCCTTMGFLAVVQYSTGIVGWMFDGVRNCILDTRLI